MPAGRDKEQNGLIVSKTCLSRSEPNTPSIGWQGDWLLSPLVELQRSHSALLSTGLWPAPGSVNGFDMLSASPNVDKTLNQSPFTIPSNPCRIPIDDEYKPSNLNKLLAYAVEGLKFSSSHAVALDSHVAFRSILWPEEDVESSYLDHPLWKALRAIDKSIFGIWQSRAQRIAVMYLFSKLLIVSSSFISYFPLMLLLILRGTTAFVAAKQ